MDTTDLRLDIDRLKKERNVHLDSEIAQCRQRLIEIRKHKISIEKEEKIYEEFLMRFMQTKYPTVWCIRCEHTAKCPSQPAGYSGRFSSPDIAEGFVPSKDGCYSYYGCRITYTVEPTDPSFLSPKQWELLDINPFE
uniref:Uncharacterized protein n=1 Tax=Marseillevirus LCMAC101 TaxID=2506602 RepID=A0A481YTQ8_9VIRU|nr:MAG: hypothetical protein LCMAC101_04890 [Marseillevirus LCMAC101]